MPRQRTKAAISSTTTEAPSQGKLNKAHQCRLLSRVWTVVYDAEDGYAFARRFFGRSERPDALVFLAEMAAIGFARAVLEMPIRLPDDLGLVVKEKVPGQMRFLRGIATLTPRYFQLGSVAAERLIDLMQKRREPPVHERLAVPLQVWS